MTGRIPPSKSHQESFRLLPQRHQLDCDLSDDNEERPLGAGGVVSHELSDFANDSDSFLEAGNDVGHENDTDVVTMGFDNDGNSWSGQNNNQNLSIGSNSNSNSALTTSLGDESQVYSLEGSSSRPFEPSPSINSELSEPSGSGEALNHRVDLELQSPSLVPRPTLPLQRRIINSAYSIFSFRQTYDRLSNGITTGRLQPNTPGRFIGLGTDGVFRNLTAKPDRELDLNLREVHPPTYEEAAADTVPEYWETGIVNPSYEDEVFVRGLPVGSFGNLIWNAIMIIVFKMVAFVLCYLLHTSHAAKEGTRIGLGVILIIFGFNILPTNFGSSDRIPPRIQPDNAVELVLTDSLSIKITGKISSYVLDITGLSQNATSTFGGSGEPYMAYAVIAFGMFTIFVAFAGFFQVKRDERMMLAPALTGESHSFTEQVYSVPE